LLEKVNLLTTRAREARASQKVSEFERQDAQNVQTRIVPPRHLIAGDLEVYGESSPAGVVGGDYFGVWQPTPDSVHLCIADVSGKGTPGALIAAMLYASVSTLSSSGSSPDLILREVEHLLQEQLKDGHYLTIVYAVFDLRSRSLGYINAGHCPPLLLRANGTVEYLGATRTVLGLGMGGDFDVQKLKVNRGDRLAFYTDGISEAANGDACEFGSDGLLAALLAASSLEPRQQYQSILQQVRSHANQRLTDDATLILASLASEAHRGTGA
jgi:sigma-B regulation protein RsbU (phosphoserine phosphatase)